MGRRRKDSGMQVSLFPFLSILACVIGSLTLIITALAVAQSQNNGGMPEDEVKRAKEFMATESQWEKEKEELKSKQKEVTELADAIMGLRKDKKEEDESLALLQGTIEVAKKDIADLDDDVSRKTQQRIENFIERIKALVEDKKKAEEEVERLKAEVEKRKNQKPIPAKVQVRDSGSGRLKGKKAFFFEAGGGSLVYHESKGKSQRFPGGTLSSNEDFFRLLDKVKKAPNGQIVFLIRSDGNGVYRKARQEAFNRSIPEGALPLDGDGELDLSYFGEQFK